MKKIIAIIIAVIMAMAFAAPVTANGQSGVIGTSVTVITGNGAAPVVKAFWVAEGTGPTDTQENGDPTHLVPGPQIKPILGYQASRTVTFYAIVADAGGVGNISSVYADVYYPSDAPEHAGELKFELALLHNGTDDFAVSVFDRAYNAGPAASPIFGMTFVNVNATDPQTGVAINKGDIDDELNQQRAVKYFGTTTFDNCQLAGRYRVVINAYNGQTVQGTFEGWMDWMPLTAADWDFNAVNYGPTPMGVNTAYKQIPGDKTFQQPDNSAPIPNPATIQNTGNTYLQMTVKQDDMALGKRIVNGVTTWNVHYGFRLADVVSVVADQGIVYYDPAVAWEATGANLAASDLPATTIQILRLCAVDKVDFFIKIDKDETPLVGNSGLMIIGSTFSAGLATDGVEVLP